MSEKRQKRGELMAAGAKPSPRGEAKGRAGVKVDISIQTAINPSKAFLSLPINFFSFHWPYTYDFLHLSEKGKRISLSSIDRLLFYI